MINPTCLVESFELIVVNGIVDAAVDPSMKLTQRGEYALRALVVLGSRPAETVVSIRTIADEQNIPHRFLEHILADLKAAGWVESRRGLAGGYRLARPAERITLAEVIRHLEGALAPVGCVSERYYETCSCPDEARCGIRSVMKEVRDETVRILERVTVAQLCQRAQRTPAPTVPPSDYAI